MAYQIDWTFNARAISEQSWSSGRQVMFTNLDSCIGVVGKTTGGKVVGIHLVLFGRDGNLFDDTGARRVHELLDGGLLGQTFIIGEYTGWQQDVGPAYASLVAGLGANVREFFARGRNIGGRLSAGGRLQYCINGHWADV